MTDRPTQIKKIGLGLIIAINVIGALPRSIWYKSGYGPVGEEIIDLHPTGGAKGEIPVRVIKEFNQGGPAYSSEAFQVYLNRSYKDNLISWYPRATLVSLATTALLCFVFERRARRA